MDLSKEEEAKDILNILLWRSQNGQTRDLSFLNKDASPYPKSLTMSTFDIFGNGDWEEQDEAPVLITGEYDHIGRLLSLQDTQNAGTGEVDEEGSRMEED